jgi:hypothetical protein
MADIDNEHAQRGATEQDTWAQLKAAAASWSRSMLADQIQATGPALRDALHAERADASERELDDFEAEL